MQNKNININVSTSILTMFLIILSIFICSSIYFLISATIFLIIIYILTEKSVNIYLNIAKNCLFLLLFVCIVYIIVMKDIVGVLIFLYKMLLIILVVCEFSLNLSFEKFNDGIKTLLNPLSKLKIDVNKLSYNITISLCFIINYINSKDLDRNYKQRFSLKKYILPRIFLAITKTKKIENNLKLKFYIPKYENTNTSSKVVLGIFVILFFIVVLKEVI